jgi:hypothetical protein
MARGMIGVILCGVLLPGCAVHELHKDQDLIRSTLLDLYTNQIMDNLVRAKSGLPIIQLDYTNAQGNVTIANTIGGNVNQVATSSNVFSLPAAALSVTRTIATTLAGNLSNVNTNQVAVAAQPVTTMNEVYDAYLQFLDETKNPGSLMVTCDPPTPGAAHLSRKFDGRYFWVPIEYRDLFFRLALLTTAQRGKSLTAPDEFFQVTLTKLTDVKSNLFPNIRVVTLSLDKPIPADMGYVVLDQDKEKTQYSLQSIPGPASSDTKVAVVNVDASNVKLFDTPQPAKIYLQHQRPKLPTTEDLINRVNFNLQQIQFNQLRQPGF